MLTGTKAWITHAGVADFYTLMVRTSDAGGRGISCLLAERRHEGNGSAAPVEHKMGLTGSPTAQLAASRARGCRSAAGIGAGGRRPEVRASTRSTRASSGIAACAVGLAQAALDEAVGYAMQRTQFGRPVIDFQGLEFLLADMERRASTRPAQPTWTRPAGGTGECPSAQASIAKLVATDMAMRVTTDAVQVLGGAGYSPQLPRRALHARGQGPADL